MNDEWSVQSNYRSSHGTSKEQEEEQLESTLPKEAATDIKALPKEATTDIPTLPNEVETENPPQVEEQDDITYPYPKYNDKLDIEAHIRALLTIWKENHVLE